MADDAAGKAQGVVAFVRPGEAERAIQQGDRGARGGGALEILDQDFRIRQAALAFLLVADIGG